MRVLVLTTDQPNQAMLVHRLGEACEVVGIVLSANVPRRPQRRRARRWANRIAERTVGRPFTHAWSRMLARCAREQDGFPQLPKLEVANVNDAAVPAAIDDLSPDLVAVSGTNLVGESIIQAAAGARGIVNLHTGISPQVKGGPNCTNWCLARGWFHLIGSSVMWLDRGIDTGNLIATERTPLSGHEDLEELHWKVMRHAHDLYVRAIAAIASDRTVPDVPQDRIGRGTTFYNADWTALEMLRARWNFARRFARQIPICKASAASLVALVDASSVDP
jgi:methionyl-tRNA formyltransferase